MTSDTLAVPSPASKILFRHPAFLLFCIGRGFSGFAYQIGAVAVGWQVYSLTHSPFDLGMIGLTQFLPMAGLTFFAGHAADRYERKRVIQTCQIIECTVAVILAWGSFRGWLSVPEIFVAVAFFASARAFESPATSALLPAVVPTGLLQKARRWAG
jgi:MFS family permease